MDVYIVYPTQTHTHAYTEKVSERERCTQRFMNYDALPDTQYIL